MSYISCRHGDELSYMTRYKKILSAFGRLIVSSTSYELLICILIKRVITALLDRVCNNTLISKKSTSC